MSRFRIAGIALTFAALMAFAARAFSTPATTSHVQAAVTPAFLQAGHCYRIAFPIDGAPAYKILEPLDGGWVRAEVDWGTAKAQRSSMWINSAQIITVAEVRCSD